MRNFEPGFSATFAKPFPKVLTIFLDHSASFVISGTMLILFVLHILQRPWNTLISFLIFFANDVTGSILIVGEQQLPSTQ